VGSQFHPEFKSRPTHPHPLFLGLVKAAKGFAEQRRSATGDADVTASLAGLHTAAD